MTRTKLSTYFPPEVSQLFKILCKIRYIYCGYPTGLTKSGMVAFECSFSEKVNKKIEPQI